MAERYAFPLLAFMACWIYTSDSFAGDLKDESTLIKNSTNSVTIYSNSDGASQGEKHALEQSVILWVDKLEYFKDKPKVGVENKKIVSDTESRLTTAYCDFYDNDPELFRSPIKVGKITFDFLHGMTPKKITDHKGNVTFTPDRKDNIALMAKGKPGVYKNPKTGEIERKELHHVQQNYTEGNVVLLPRKIHKEHHGIFHPFSTSRKNAEWPTVKGNGYKKLAKIMREENDTKENHAPLNSSTKREGAYLESSTKFKKQKAA